MTVDPHAVQGLARGPTGEWSDGAVAALLYAVLGLAASAVDNILQCWAGSGDFDSAATDALRPGMRGTYAR